MVYTPRGWLCPRCRSIADHCRCDPDAPDGFGLCSYHWRLMYGDEAEEP